MVISNLIELYFTNIMQCWVLKSYKKFKAPETYAEHVAKHPNGYVQAAMMGTPTHLREKYFEEAQLIGDALKEGNIKFKVVREVQYPKELTQNVSFN